MEGSWNQAAVTLIQRALEELKHTLHRSDGWVEKESSKGVTTYLLPTDSIPISKSIAEINAPIEAIISLVRDTNNVIHWFDQLKTINVLQESNGVRLVKFAVKSRWPMDDREFLYVDSTFSENDNNTVFLIEKSIELPSVPVERKHVRATFMISGLIFERIGENRTRVTNISQFNPFASVPGSIMEKIQVKTAANKLTFAKERLG